MLEAGVDLNVYHNRRRDADILTLASVLASGKLGQLWRVHSIMDQDNAGSLEVGSSGGLLRDLGSHLVDQMLWLLGPARLVHATLDWTDRFGERTDCGTTQPATWGIDAAENRGTLALKSGLEAILPRRAIMPAFTLTSPGPSVVRDPNLCLQWRESGPWKSLMLPVAAPWKMQ